MFRTLNPSQIRLRVVVLCAGMLGAAPFIGPAATHADGFYAVPVKPGWYGSQPMALHQCRSMVPIVTGSDGKWLYMAVCLSRVSRHESQQVVVVGNTSASSFGVSPQHMVTTGTEYNINHSALGPVHSGTSLCGAKTIKPGQNLWCAASLVNWPDRNTVYELYASVTPVINGTLVRDPESTDQSFAVAPDWYF